MNFILVWQLAIRYLRGKRSANVVPVLSRISMVAIAISSGAMVMVFSVFNGEEGLVKDMYKAFYPDIRIKTTKGKFFSLDNEKLAAIKGMHDITHISTVLEDNVMLVSNIDSPAQQRAATLKGIDKEYFHVNNLKPYIVDGADSVTIDPIPTALIGRKVADQMGLDVRNNTPRITAYYPNAHASSFDPTTSFQSQIFKPEGVFVVTDEFDSRLILVPLSLVQDLFLEKNKYSSLEIKLAPDADDSKVQERLQGLLGSSFKVETRFEQNKTVYMVMRTEKWAVYAILVLVLLIASFNMIGGLSLLVLEKRKDMAILKVMGAEPATIRRIFLLEGVLWTLIGGVTGVIIGGIICVGQQYFHWIKMSGSFVVDAFPVQMQWLDFVLVIATVMLVGVLAAWYPAMRATRTEDPSLKAS